MNATLLPTRRSRTIARSARGAHRLYRCYDSAGLLLYIGCSSDPSRRLDQHCRSNNATSRLIQQYAATVEVDADTYPSRDAARDAEAAAIEAEQPLLNIQHRGVPADFAREQIANYVASRAT